MSNIMRLVPGRLKRWWGETHKINTNNVNRLTLQSSNKLLGILAPVNAITRDNSGIRRVHALVAVVAAVVRVVHPPPSKRVVPDEVKISFAAGARIVALLRVIPMCAHALVRVTDAAHAVGTNVCVEGLATT